MKRKRKAMSTVTTAVMLMAVAIATQHANTASTGAFWSIESTFETLHLMNVSCTTDSYDNWVITVTIKNPRRSSIAVGRVYVNDTLAMPDCNPPTEAVATITTDLNSSWLQIQEGEEDTITIWIGAINARANATFSLGSIVDIKLRSVSGGYYSVLIELKSGTGFVGHSGYENLRWRPRSRRSSMIIEAIILIVLIGLGIFWHSHGLLVPLVKTVAVLLAVYMLVIIVVFPEIFGILQFLMQ